MLSECNAIVVNFTIHRVWRPNMYEYENPFEFTVKLKGSEIEVKFPYINLFADSEEGALWNISSVLVLTS